MKPKIVDGDSISILCVGRERGNLAVLLDRSGLPYTCDWVEGGEASLKQDYHDVAVICLGDRAQTHKDPLPEPTRAGLSLVSSTGVPAVILGTASSRSLLDGLTGNWDWDFVDENEAADDPYLLLRGMRSALVGYLKAAENPESCHRHRALSRIEDHFVGAMPWE